jgi:hypothetical protein
MKKMPLFIGVFALLLATTCFATANNPRFGLQTTAYQHPASSPSQTDHHAQHHAEMNQRGDHVMGFSQQKTTHHFRLFQDGGAIEVRANDAKDSESVGQIRMHLSHIAKMFADGNFAIPTLVHDETPPGAKVMEQMKAEIAYQYEELEQGGRIRLKSTNAQALAAIYDFLRYQIKEHQTGDALEVGRQ